MALLFSIAPVPAQSDIAGAPLKVEASPADKPAEPAAPAAPAPANAAADAPDPAEVQDNPSPAPGPAPAAASDTPTDPGDVNAPNDPPPVSQLFPSGAEEEAPADMSQNVTINLLKIMVKKGLITQMEAIGLIKEAEKEAGAARAAAKARKDAEAAEEDEAMKVSYVPDSVRNQMREEIRRQVLADLGAATPDGKNSAVALALPGLAEDKFDLFGDIRLRYEFINYPDSGNDNTGSFPNFNAINTGAPFDTAGFVFSPQRNVDQDRVRYRYRVRVGGEWRLEDGFSAGIRIATGENNSPVTTNQSVGLTNQGQGGGFSKYAIWLDRAFVKYQTDFGTASAAELELLGGRFDSPFMATAVIFDEDLGFDGLAFKLKGKLGNNVTPWLTAGAFPLFNTDLNFSSNQPAKFESSDKYLFAAQAGVDLKLSDTLKLKLGIAYYDFDKVQGELSEPFLPLMANDAGPTDNTRPSFAQAGNTYKPLRQIIPDATNNFGTSNQFQYFGLASKFTPVVASARLEYSGWEPAQIALNAEYIKNTAFNREEIEPVAVNNRGQLAADPPATTTTSAAKKDTTAPAKLGLFDGDDTAWTVGIKFGKLAMMKKGDWTVGADYRYIGSDAVVDGFNDSDFNGGGTNVKGFVFSGAYALTPNASLGIIWNTNDQIAGPPLKSDYLMLDFKLKF
jgi:opacity protein-like surface antigen